MPVVSPGLAQFRKGFWVGRSYDRENELIRNTVEANKKPLDVAKT